MTTSAVLGIPYISGQQNQPEVTHNEALNMLQAMLLGGVLQVGLDTPPGSPSPGDSYVIGSAPTGAWAGHANAIASYLSSQWVFLPGLDDSGTIIPMGTDQEGLRVWDISSDAFFVWSDQNASPGVMSWTEITIQSTPAADYGELDISNNATTIAVTAAVDSTLKTNSDYTQITGIWDSIPHGQNNGVTQQTNSFTVAATGVYKIEVWATVTSDANNTRIAIKPAVNGTISLVRRPSATISTAGDSESLAAHGFVSLTSGDVITLYHAADKTCNIIWEDMVFSINEQKRF